MKYYAVKEGKKKGIYETWDECQEQVKGYKNAKFKSFKTKEEAEKYITETVEVVEKEPVENETFVFYSLKKKDNYFNLAVIIKTSSNILRYVTKLNVDMNIYYARLYGVIAALELASKLGYKNIKIFFDDMSVHNYITREYNPLKGKNKDVTMDYYNLFVIVTRSSSATVEFSAISENSILHKEAVGIAKNRNSFVSVDVEDIREQKVDYTYFTTINE